jgi:hypothetical protein
MHQSYMCIDPPTYPPTHTHTHWFYLCICLCACVWGGQAKNHVKKQLSGQKLLAGGDSGGMGAGGVVAPFSAGRVVKGELKADYLKGEANQTPLRQVCVCVCVCMCVSVCVSVCVCVVSGGLVFCLHGMTWPFKRCLHFTFFWDFFF